jgi:hypothetical protein
MSIDEGIESTGKKRKKPCLSDKRKTGNGAVFSGKSDFLILEA